MGELPSLIDIGTAQGGLPVRIAQAHPHLTGGGFDLPAVEPLFTRYVAAHGLADRLRFHPGDFLRDPLPTADVLVMGHILHDWDLEEKQQLLAKAYEALPAGGALIVYDMLIDDERRQNAIGLLMSLNMLIETPGGFDYTGADCVGWMRQAGFREARVEHLTGSVLDGGRASSDGLAGSQADNRHGPSSPKTEAYLGLKTVPRERQDVESSYPHSRPAGYVHCVRGHGRRHDDTGRASADRKPAARPDLCGAAGLRLDREQARPSSSIPASTSRRRRRRPAPATAAIGPVLYDNLGTLTVPVTTRAPEAQRYFDQGLRLAYALQPRRGGARVPRGAGGRSDLRHVLLGRGLGAGSQHQLPDAARGRGAGVRRDRPGHGAARTAPARASGR